jgi:hypothetical protein
MTAPPTRARTQRRRVASAVAIIEVTEDEARCGSRPEGDRMVARSDGSKSTEVWLDEPGVRIRCPKAAGW